jgi:hypothetical protein
MEMFFAVFSCRWHVTTQRVEFADGVVKSADGELLSLKQSRYCGLQNKWRCKSVCCVLIKTKSLLWIAK